MVSEIKKYRMHKQKEKYGIFNKRLSMLLRPSIIYLASIIAWLPHIINPRDYGDQLAETISHKIICNPGIIHTGWPINSTDIGASLGSFSPTITGYIVIKLSCLSSNMTGITTIAAYTLIGIGITSFLTYYCARLIGLSETVSSIIGFGMCTAPCAFSRYGHIQLAQMWCIMPCIVTCICLIARGKSSQNRLIENKFKYWTGLALGIASFTAQEYYAVFSVMMVALCYVIGALIEKRGSDQLSCNRNVTQKDKVPVKIILQKLRNVFISKKYMSIALGYIGVMILVLYSKYLWGIPEWSGAATARSPYEQFLYGFWPINFITSPLYNEQLVRTLGANRLPVTETPFNSSSGIVVIFAVILFVLDIVFKRDSQRGVNNNVEVLKTSTIIVFGVASFIALVFCVAGGMGTLFAVYISPQLRALNRITPYFYSAALCYFAIYIEIIHKRLRGSNT